MTTAGELRDLLLLAGHPSRVRGEEVLLEVCWSCGNDRWNMELNASKGVWHCWACGGSGIVEALLRKHLGESPDIPVRLDAAGAPTRDVTPVDSPPSRPVHDVPSAAAYLARRGIPGEVAERYGLAVCVSEGHPLHGRILIPMLDFFRPAEVLGYMGRAYVPRTRPKYKTTAARKVLWGWRTRARTSPVVVVEGGFDGIAVHRAGFQAAVIGGTTSPEVEVLAARLPPETPLLVCLDGAAREEAERLTWRIRAVRPAAFLVPLPPTLDPGSVPPEALRVLITHYLPNR